MSHRVRWVSSWLCLGLVCACSEGSRTLPLDGALAGDDCVIVVLDALGAKHLGAYGERRPTSPNIDSLARRGVLFAHAWSQSSWTLPSTASLMTGLYQEVHGVERSDLALDSEAFTLAEAFSAAGYRTLAFVQNPLASDRYGFAQGFDHFESVVDARGEMAKAIRRRLPPRARDGRPTFLYVHFRRPHIPYDPYPDDRAGFVSSDYTGSFSGVQADLKRHNKGVERAAGADLRHLRDLYQANIRSADGEVRQALETFDLARTLVVITSDHGEAFDEHGRLGHNISSFEELVHIPLIVVHPKLAAGTTVHRPVMTVDLMPTLVGLFGLTGPGAGWARAPMDGRSLQHDLVGEEEASSRAAVFTSSRAGPRQMKAAFDGRLKYVRMPNGSERLYELGEDPGEERDRSADRPDDVRRLRELLKRHLDDREGLEARPITQPLAEEQERRLRVLGYVE